MLGFVPASAFAAVVERYYPDYSSAFGACQSANTFLCKGVNGSDSLRSDYQRASYISYSGTYYYYAYPRLGQVDCPAGIDLATGDCVAPPAPVCPAAGTEYTLGFAPASGGPITVGNKKSLDGCTLVAKFRTVDCYESPAGSADCKMMDGYEYTGEPEPAGDPSPPVVDPEGVQPVDVPDTEPLSDGKNLKPETTETIIQDTVTEVMPDGTVVKQDVTTKITTKGIGTNIETTTEEKKIVRDNGITKTQTTTTTTTTNPDGSKSVQTVTDTSYDQSDKELIIVKNADGSISIVKNDGYSGSSKTTNTKNYDADGKKTSETEEKEKTGDEDESPGAFCEENPEAMECKEKGGAIEGGLYQPDDTTLESVFQGFKTKLDDSDIGQALGGFYEVSVGASCPRWAVDVWVFKFDLDQMCSATMINALGLAAYVILATASFFAFRIAFL